MEQWIHLNNPFDSVTVKSRKKMLILITDHSSKITASGNAVINGLAARTTPVKNDFSSKWSVWSVANGQWRAETNRVNAALKLLSSDKIEAWDITIQTVFRQNTPEYISLLPNHRIPFQQGTMDEIITAVGSLAIALASYPAQPVLVTLKGEVEIFHADLLSKRDVQQQKEQHVKNASDELEAARLASAEMMFRNLGILIDTYPSEPEIIANYYQLDLIQNGGKEPVEYSGTLAPDEQKNVVSTGVTQQSVVYIKNTGYTAIKFCLTDNPATIDDPDQSTILQPGEEFNNTENLPELTAYFINVKNLSSSAEGAYLVMVS